MGCHDRRWAGWNTSIDHVVQLRVGAEEHFRRREKGVVVQGLEGEPLLKRGGGLGESGWISASSPPLEAFGLTRGWGQVSIVCIQPFSFGEFGQIRSKSKPERSVMVSRERVA